MAELEVSGKTELLFIDPLGGTAYSLIVCLISNGMSLSTDTINSSSKCGSSSSPGPTKADVSFEGNVMQDPDATHISSADLFSLWKNSTNFSWKMGKAVPASNDVTYTSSGFISALSITYPDGVATFSGTIAADAITQVITP